MCSFRTCGVLKNAELKDVCLLTVNHFLFIVGESCFTPLLFGLGEAPGLKVEGEGRNIPHIITTPEPETAGLTAFDPRLSKFR